MHEFLVFCASYLCFFFEFDVCECECVGGSEEVVIVVVVVVGVVVCCVCFG